MKVSVIYPVSVHEEITVMLDRGYLGGNTVVHIFKKEDGGEDIVEVPEHLKEASFNRWMITMGELNGCRE
jgi:hypothetical protein